MTVQEQKQLVRESELEAWNDGNVDVFDAIYTDEYIMHTPMGDRDLAGVKEMVEAVRSGTSQFEFEVDDLIGEDDRVVLRYTLSGRNTGPSFLTDEPTGKSWEGSGISIYRFEDGKVAEQWDRFDYLGVMQQLGLIPAAANEATV
ncbi:ester cyclase [Halobaculum limi]|uniref:ester cyclase n=1 Tax=Halobaculum limi TaxID=3031916 RepID=UPI002406F456|nr:ester cyclase [Halobaculum sp. YSMS11]